MRFTIRPGVRRRIHLVAATALFAVASACGGGDTTSATSTTQPGTNSSDDPTPTTTTGGGDVNGLQSTGPAQTSTTPTPTPTTVTNCVIHLHGKGGSGSAITVVGNVTHVSPTGNGTGWGGRQWSYATSAEFDAARAIVADAASDAGCTRVVINGFSNGAAFAAKLYCRGESLGATLAGIVVDDPVPDHGTADCAPAPGVDVALYWTGGLDDPAQPGWDCSKQDWTCEGGTTVGIDAYASAMRTSAKASPHSDHQRYENPPEHGAWLGV